MKHSGSRQAFYLALFFAFALVGAFSIVAIRLYFDPNLKYPLDEVFYFSGQRFRDFFDGTRIPHFQPLFWTLPPTMLALYYGFQTAIDVFGSILPLVLFSILWLILLWRGLSPLIQEKYPRAASAALILLAFPVLFCLDRGHFAGLVVALLILAWNDVAYGPGTRAKYFIALAACLKITPIGFILLLIWRRLFKEAALTVVITGVVTMASALLIKYAVDPNYSWTVFRNGLQLYFDLSALGPVIDFDSTIWAGIRNSIFIFDSSSKDLLTNLATIWQIVGLALGFLLFIGALRRHWTLQTLMILTCLYLLLIPLVMQDYYLMLLLLPILTLMKEPKGSRDLVLAWLLATAMIAKPIFIMGDVPVRLSTLINPILMLFAGILASNLGLSSASRQSPHFRTRITR